MKNRIYPLIFIFSLNISITTVAAQAGIKPTGGPLGGFITTLNSLGNNVYAGSDEGGLYRTTDEGLTWTQINLEAYSLGTPLYIFTTDSLVFCGLDNNGYLWKSADNGDSWEQIPTLYTYSMAKTINHLVACTFDQKILVSGLSGERWDTVYTFPNSVQLNCVFADADTLYLGTTANGIFKSYDQGSTWVSSSTGFDSLDVIQFVQYHNQIYAAMDGGGIWSSADHGAHWQVAINNGIGCGYILCMAVIRDSLMTVGNGGDGISVFDSSNSVWYQLPEPLGVPQVWQMLMHNGNFFAGTGQGVFVSSNMGTTWSLDNSGLQAASIGPIAGNGQYLAAATTNQVFLSSDSGASWAALPLVGDSIATSRPQILSFSNDTLTVVDAGNSGYYISYTTDYGLSWNHISTNLPAHTELNFFNKANRILVDWSDPGGEFHLSYSDDWGGTWTSSPLPDSSYVALFDFGNEILASGPGSSPCFVSADRGASWSSINLPLSSSGRIHSSSFYNGTIYLATDSGVLISSDNGNSWVNNGPFYGIFFNRNIFKVFSLNGKTYASSVNTIFELDSLNNWNSVIVDSLALNLSAGIVQNGKYFMPTGSSGVYYFDDGSTTGLQSVKLNDISVYPNPACSQLWVNSPECFITEIRITDMLGKTLLHRNELEHYSLLDVSALSAGVYLVSANTENGLFTQRVVITR